MTYENWQVTNGISIYHWSLANSHMSFGLPTKPATRLQSLQEPGNILSVGERFLKEFSELLQTFENCFDREFVRIDRPFQFFPLQGRGYGRMRPWARRVYGGDGF